MIYAIATVGHDYVKFGITSRQDIGKRVGDLRVLYDSTVRELLGLALDHARAEIHKIIG